MNLMARGDLRLASPAPGKRALAKQRTREKILAAAKTLFSERGYEGATVRDIASAAGMSTGAVFASFADKSDLFVDIVSAESEARLEVMRQAAEGCSSPGEAILAMLEAAARRNFADLSLFRATMSAVWAPALGAKLAARVGRYAPTELFMAVLKDALPEDSRGGAQLRLRAQMLWDAYLSVIRRAEFGGMGLEDVMQRLKAEARVILGEALIG